MQGNPHRESKGNPELPLTLADIGLDKMQDNRAIKLAAIPDEAIEKYVANVNMDDVIADDLIATDQQKRFDDGLTKPWARNAMKQVCPDTMSAAKQKKKHRNQWAHSGRPQGPQLATVRAGSTSASTGNRGTGLREQSRTAANQRPAISGKDGSNLQERSSSPSVSENPVTQTQQLVDHVTAAAVPR